jgi:hypothetical protein
MGRPANSLTVKTTVGSAEPEVKGFLGLWDVDFSRRSITFSNIVKPETQPFPGFLRVIEAGTFDRYYIRMDAPFCRQAKVDKAFVVAQCLSAQELKITIGEGYDNRQPGFSVHLH